MNLVAEPPTLLLTIVIMAKRSGFENIRMADKTEIFAPRPDPPSGGEHLEFLPVF
jgi:hypothetical protein